MAKLSAEDLSADDADVLALSEAHHASEIARLEAACRTFEGAQDRAAFEVLCRAHARIERLAAHGYTLEDAS